MEFIAGGFVIIRPTRASLQIFTSGSRSCCLTSKAAILCAHPGVYSTPIQWMGNWALGTAEKWRGTVKFGLGNMILVLTLLMASLTYLHCRSL